MLSVGALDATVSGVDMGVAATHVAPLECHLLMPIRQTADPERKEKRSLCVYPDKGSCTAVSEHLFRETRMYVA